MTKAVALLTPTTAASSPGPVNSGGSTAGDRSSLRNNTAATNARKSVSVATTGTTTDASTTLMKAEIDAAVSFLTYLLVKAQFSIESAELFRKALTELLRLHYKGHWYPQEPLKGSGYRCLRVNGVTHPLLAKAADLCKLPLQQVRRAFPAELTVWVDPGDVSVRFGEEGSIGVFYAKQEESAKILNIRNRLNFSPADIDKAIVDGNFTLFATPPKRNNGDSSSSLHSNNNSNRSSPDLNSSGVFSSRQTTPSKSLPSLSSSPGGYVNGHHQHHHHHGNNNNSCYHHQHQARFHNNGFWNQQQQASTTFDNRGAINRYAENKSPPNHQVVFRRFAPAASETCNMEYQLYGNVHMSSLGNEGTTSGNNLTVSSRQRIMEPVSAV